MEPRVLINYYIRKGWFDHAQRLCESLLEKKGSDPVLQFWRAFAIAQERSYSSAIRELESLKKKKDVELPCLHALLYAHSQCKLVDHDELAQLEVQLVMAEEHATEQSLLLCANLFWHIHEPAKARKILDQLLSSRTKTNSATQLRASVLRGWIDLTVEPKTKRDADVRENAIHYLDQVKENDAERLLGLAKFYDLKKNFPKALECFDELLVKHAWFPHGVSEKALVLLKMGQWDQCLDSVERALSDNPRDLEALRIRILHLLSRDGKPREAATHIRELGDALKKSEPSNPQLYYEMAACNARLSDRNHEVLHCNLALIEQAIQLDPESGVYRAERGYQRSLLEDYGEAMDGYKDALRLDESNEMALHGLIYCQIKLGQLDDASQQMEFLSVVQESMGASAGFVFLQALLSGSKDKDRGRQVQLLNKSVQLHMDHLKTTIQHADVSTHELMRQLDPLFLVEVSTEFLSQDSSPRGGGEDETASVVAKGISILEKLVKKSPGFLRAQFVLAQAYFVTTRLDDAYHTCNMLLKMDPAHAQAHMLQARICMERDHVRAASACLDQALSHDFSIRQSLAYCIVKAKLLETSGDVRDAYQTLQAAMKMLAPSTTTGSCPPAKGKRLGASAAQPPPSPISSELAQFDRASVYIQMAQVLSQLNDVPEATRIVREALQVFRGSSQEVRVLVANSELAIKRGDHDAAIALLSNVPPSSPAFAKAQMLKADIFLTHRKDKHQYARCFQELVAMTPTHSAHVNMAEAYLRIQMLDQAIDSFRAAAALSPNDPTLAGRIGKVLIAKHDYLKAVDYYESALKLAPLNLLLRKDLAELYAKLAHFDQALRVIQQAPPNESDEISDLLQTVELQLLLPSIHRGLGNADLSIQALLKAYSIQKLILDKQKNEQPDVITKQKRAIAETCFQVAQIYADRTTGSDQENVLKYATLALRSDETHEGCILFLARTYRTAGDLDQCQARCTTLLRLNPSHEEAAIMLADLMLQKEDYESAIYHFQQLLESKPDNFAALSRFIVMLRRAGKLATVPRYLKLAERSGVRVAHSPGLFFCKGLYARYKNNVREAIEAFNLARRDPEWGRQALIHMTEIYLNPDNENLWTGNDSDPSNANTNTKEQTENIRIANTLLDELPSGAGGGAEGALQIKVLEAYAVLAVKTKPMLDKAIQLFMELLEHHDRDFVPALLGLATAYMLTKQQPKARNQLKRIAKMDYDQSLAEDFERSYLMLADLYVDRSKYDLAQELCKKALVHNKSSGKAWELLGLIMEKEQSYIDAAECYQEAWSCEGEASASIGFKLAFNYLKAKKYVAAVDVCYKVLDQYPDYPKIRKEILEKAFAGFRP